MKVYVVWKEEYEGEASKIFKVFSDGKDADEFRREQEERDGGLEVKIDEIELE